MASTHIPIRPKRRRLRFSLRTLFVVMTVAAMLTGWGVYQVNWIHRRHEVLEKYDGDLAEPGGAIKVPGMLWVYGERPVATIYVYLPDDPNDPALGHWFDSHPEVVRIQRLFPEATINGRYRSVVGQLTNP